MNPLPGEQCQAPAEVCMFGGTDHSHCGCGWPIPIGAGFCALCIREFIRGAVMTNRELVGEELVLAHPNRIPKGTSHRTKYLLPPGYKSWQHTPFCRHGHEMTEENVYWITSGLNRKRYRCCKACRREANSASWHRLKQNVRLRRSQRTRPRALPPGDWRATRRCVECGKEFQPRHPQHWFCTPTHRASNYKRHLRKLMKEAA